jgi:hypothetical protein
MHEFENDSYFLEPYLSMVVLGSIIDHCDLIVILCCGILHVFVFGV